jgi:hypothetical protein
MAAGRPWHRPTRLEAAVNSGRINALVGTPLHLSVVRKVADQSLTLLKNDGVLPLGAGRPSRKPIS